jgi:aspartate-semialdehyde dehydrogenase
MDADVPILIPEVNGPHLELVKQQYDFPEGFIVTNPNCSTSGLAMSLGPLMRFSPKRVHVSTYQAISGAGYPGIPSYSISGNIIPYIEKEEEKMRIETGKIFGSMENGVLVDNGIEVIPSCARVPIKDGHLISVHAEFENEFHINEMKEALRSMKGLEGLPSAPDYPIIINDEDDRPQPSKDVLAGEPLPGMSVTMGRFRMTGKVLSYFLLVNNTIRGGAGNAILSGELAYRKGFIGGG